MTPIPTLIRRWKILMTLTVILMTATVGLMFWRFSSIQVVTLFTQTILLLTQRCSVRMLKEIAV